MIREEFILKTIEANSFYARLMREHTVFLSASIPQKYASIQIRLENFRKQYDILLTDTIAFANPKKRNDLMVSKVTAQCESQATALLGIYINTQLTLKQLQLASVPYENINRFYEPCIALNGRGIKLTTDFLEFKRVLYKQIIDGQIYFALFPSMVMHMASEAEEYITELEMLKRQEKVSNLQRQSFWGERALEHSKVASSLFDPSETLLREKNEEFVEFFEYASKTDFDNEDAVEGLKRYGLFNTELSVRLLERRAQSVLLPLFFDHIYREAIRGYLN